MMMFRKFMVLTAAVLTLGACGENDRYLLEDAPPAKARGTAAKLIQVEKIDLPEYFAGGEITFQNEKGILVTSPKNFWADTPERAFTEMVAEALDERLSANVASSPWPFEIPADLKVEIKVRRFVALSSGIVALKGQYFLSSPFGGSLARAKRFSIQEPITDEGLAGMTAAFSRALSQLSDQIAGQVARVSGSEL